MRYAKTLGLVAMVAAALMACAGSASATTLTSVTGTTVLGNGSLIRAESEPPHIKTDGSVVTTCTNSTIEGEITSAHGATGVIATLTNVTFTNCYNTTVTVVPDLNGHYGTLRINSSHEVFSTGLTKTIVTHNILGTVHCLTKTDNTKIGTLTDSHDTGGTATLDIGTSPIPEEATDTFACKDDFVWTGNYKFTTPDTLYVD